MSLKLCEKGEDEECVRMYREEVAKGKSEGTWDQNICCWEGWEHIHLLPGDLEF